MSNNQNNQNSQNNQNGNYNRNDQKINTQYNNMERDPREKDPEVEKRIRIVIVVIAAILVIFVILAIKFEAERGQDTKTEDVKISEQRQPSKYGPISEEMQTEGEANEGKVYTPTFMYFVSKTDEKYSEYMAAVNEVQAEYASKIQFQIIDIDEDPEKKENFEDIVGMGMPALIMLDTKNNICGINISCVEKATMVENIKRALGE